jgi:chaperonin GroES
MMLRPIDDNVIVQDIDQEGKTDSGIILPGTANDKPLSSVIVAVGPGTHLKVGDEIVRSRYKGTDITYEGEDYRVVNQSDVLAVRRGEEEL